VKMAAEMSWSTSQSSTTGKSSCVQKTSAAGGAMKSAIPSPFRSIAEPERPLERPETWRKRLMRPSPVVSSPTVSLRREARSHHITYAEWRVSIVAPLGEQQPATSSQERARGLLQRSLLNERIGEQPGARERAAQSDQRIEQRTG
jgi:hypothetical protein